jgi:hypothetical protein
MNETVYPQPIIDPSLTWRMLDGDAVIVAPTTGKIRVLNQAGAMIWQSLMEKKSVAEIQHMLETTFDLSAEQAQEDLLAFLLDLVQRGMISWEPTK